MLNYRSISDLSNCIRKNAYKIPHHIELIVGIPRSGLLAASMLSLHSNLKFCDVNSFIENRKIDHGSTRTPKFPELEFPHDAKSVLFFDDSIESGRSLNRIKEKIDQINWNGREFFGACYASQESSEYVDLYFEVVPQQRLFEWNIMHRDFLKHCCVDIDGVLCRDPLPHENDDGQQYLNFIRTVRPNIVPSYRISTIVTNRLERYRRDTEDWLKSHGIDYERLEMLDLPNAKARQASGDYASNKARVFRSDPRNLLFIESDRNQAEAISKLSGKHTLCFETQELFHPKITSIPRVLDRHNRAMLRAKEFFIEIFK